MVLDLSCFGHHAIYGPLPNTYTLIKLRDLCTDPNGIQTGPFGSQLHQQDYQVIGTPIITVEHLGDNRVRHCDMPRVTDDDYARLARYALKKGDIVFSRVGSVDRRALIRDEESGWLFSGRCLRIRPDPAKIDPVYLSWFFGLPAFKEHIRRIAVGATMPSLNTALLSNVEVIVMPRKDQEAIVTILGALDDKIELNRRMNETLEAIAHALFTSWFVDFDPVHAKMAGRQPEGMDADMAALFPSRLAESASGATPEGWHISSLGDIVELAYGKALKEDIRRPGTIPVYGANGQIGWHDDALVQGPGIIIGRKGTPGIITWSQRDFVPIDTTFYVVPKEPEPSLHFLFHALRRANLASLGADSAVPGVNRQAAYMTTLVVPDVRVLAVFETQLGALTKRGASNDQESSTLTSLRDMLLPKLLSGAIRVTDAERHLEAVL